MSKDIVLHSTEKLDIKFPEPYDIDKKRSLKSQDLIKKTSIYNESGKTFINKNSISHLLGTDKKGVNKIYNNADNEDKIENGNNKYLSTSATKKEISKRIEEPRDTLEREHLKDTEKNLIALRDFPDLEKLREIKESKIRKELPKVKEKKRKLEKEDYVTGELLTKPEVHHIERVADNPNKALDEDNLVVVNQDTHKEIHKEGAESKEKLEEFKKNWNKNK